MKIGGRAEQYKRWVEHRDEGKEAKKRRAAARDAHVKRMAEYKESWGIA